MASVQCSKDAEKTYYLQNCRGQRTEHAMNHTEWHGQRENYFPSRHGHVAEGYGYVAEGHRYSAEGHADMAQGHDDSHGHMAQGLGHVAEGLGYMAEGLGQKVQKFGRKVQGLGHKVQAKGQHSEHGMVKTHAACKGPNKGHYPGPYAQNHIMGQNNVHRLAQQKEYSPHDVKPKKNAEYQKEETIIMKRKEYRAGGNDSDFETDSETDSERF